MKKTILILGFALLALTLSANPVSKSKTATLARTFLGSDELTEVPFLQSESSILTKASSSDEQIFHAYNRKGGGWVIMAGDDLLAPVIGYSNTGSIGSEIPANMQAYFKGIKKNLSKVRAANPASDAKVKASWSRLEARTSTIRTASSSGKLLQTAKWGQYEPFNNLCPTISGESQRSLTGCVATAMAIVMRYHGWPEHGTGTLDGYSYYDYKSRKQNISGYSIEDHVYDWTIPLTYSSSWTAEQENSAATLVHDLGVSVMMEYSYTYGSGAISSDVLPALVNHFGYDGTMKEIYRYLFSNEEWFNMIKAEIDADRPLLYGGSDEINGDGHQFVCDGYDAQGNVHINWGWEGELDGYYAVSYIGDRKDSGVGDVFNYFDSAVFGIRPYENHSTLVSTSLFMFASDEYSGISLEEGVPYEGDFTINVGWITNDSYYADYSGKIRPVLVGSDGIVKEVIASEEEIEIEHINNSDQYDATYTSFDCHISGPIAVGDAIEMQYQDGDGSWIKLPAEMAFKDTVGDGSSIASLGVFDAAYIRVPANLVSGQKLYFELIPGWRVPGSIVWYYDNAKKEDGYAVLSSGDHTIKAVVTIFGGSQDTITAKIHVN